MKKIKILAVVLTFSLLYKGQIFAINKNLEQTKTKELQIEKKENVKNNITEKEKEKYNVKGYKITQIVEINGYKTVCYEHIKSGAQILVNLIGDMKNYIIKSCPHCDVTPTFAQNVIFFRHIPDNNFGVAHGLDHFLGNTIEKKLEKKFSIQELIKFFGCNSASQTPPCNSGSGFYFTFTEHSPEIIKIILEELKNPAFLKNSEIVKSEVERMKLELKEKLYEKKKEETTTYYKNLNDRFSFGKFAASGKIEELNKLNNMSYLKKQYEKIVHPSNCLITINEINNNNYKQIMKQFDDEYFKNFTKREFKPKNVNKLSETKPYREFDVEHLKCLKYLHNIFPGTENLKDKNFKYRARLFWDVSKLPLEQRDVFMIDTPAFWNILRKDIEKMGYSVVSVLNDSDHLLDGYDSLAFDGLFYIDIFGDDEKAFEKEKLEENGKKLTKLFYEKLKNMSDDELKFISQIKNGHYINLASDFKDIPIRDRILKSYCLTNNPFSKKFFEFKDNRTIKMDIEELVKIYKNNKDKFELLYNNNPKYIDVFKSKKSKEAEKTKEFDSYVFPLKFKDVKTKNNELNFMLTVKDTIAEDLIENIFLKPNIVDKGLSYIEHFFSDRLIISSEKLNEIEKYVFGKFKKEIANFTPTKEQFNEYRNKTIKDIELYIKQDSKIVNKSNEILNDSKKFNGYLKLLKKNLILQLNSYKDELYKNNKIISINEKNTKLINNIKKDNKRLKKEIKEIEKNLNSKDSLIKYGRERLNYVLKQYKTKPEILKNLENVKNLKYEDFIKYFKDFEFQTSPHFKKTKETKKTKKH